MASFTRVLIVLLVLGWACGASGQIYEWIDEDGIRRFTNKPLPAGVTPVASVDEVPFDALADSARRYLESLEMQRLLEHWRMERQIAMEQRDAERRRLAEDLNLRRMAYQLEEAMRWNRFHDAYFGPSYVPVFPAR
ncbi:hypothetical protein D3OALGA1CA_4979 [Olavius algarvensis associated proteobacterium Delta 3]|nr:hypothetical protein D3OALGA1CA_4979 [Olavius algarvensis associated proteobacterium Delta 3]